MKSGGQQRKFSCPTTPSQVQTQQEETTFQVSRSSHNYFTISAGGRKVLFLPQQQPSQRETVPTQSMKSHSLYFKLPVYSHGLFVCNSLATFPILLYKRPFFFVCELPMVWPVAFLAQIATLLFPSKTIFAGKMTFTFNVNITCNKKWDPGKIPQNSKPGGQTGAGTHRAKRAHCFLANPGVRR